MKNALFLIVFWIPILLFSQKKQPKVGLVLSGGGAKGFAHVSVLKELEKAGVQIDYIGGTSIGAIVGGLYATGYSAKQIEDIIIKTDFYNILQDKIPRKSKSFFDKEYSEKHAISLPIRKGTIGLPRGVSKGQNILNLFEELLAPVDSIQNFSKLPIPFYCIATNAETGNQELLEKGSLALALRASGSFPTLLYPVEMDGKLLIDGGIVNNFPVKEMKKKGMDIIIGVDVQGKLANKKNLTSGTTILNQIISYQLYKKKDAQKKDVDVYIHPNMNNYNVFSFDKKKEIIEESEKAINPMIPVFDSIAKLQTKKKIRKKIQLKSKKFLVDRIIINGNKNYTRGYILGTLRLKEGDSISYKLLSKKIDNLTATKNFNQISYHFKKSFSGKKLTLKIKENKTRTNLRLGLHYDLLYKSAVLLNYNHKKLFLKNDTFSLDVIVGDNIRYNLDYFVDNGFFWSYGLKSNYNNFKTNLLFNFGNINKIDIRFQDFSNTIYAQTTFNRKFAFGIGIEHKNLLISSKTLKTTNNNFTVFDESNYISGFAYLKIDTFDKKYFVTKGFYANLNIKGYLFSDRNQNLKKNELLFGGSFNKFSQIRVKIGFATTFWNSLTFQYTIEGGFFLGNTKFNVFNFRLGGYNQNYINTFIPFYGYDIGDLDKSSFLKSEFNFRYQFLKNNYVTFIANYARVEDNVLSDIYLFKNIKSGYAVGYSLNTFLGPIELKYSWSPDISKNYWLFNLGFWF